MQWLELHNGVIRFCEELAGVRTCQDIITTSSIPSCAYLLPVLLLAAYAFGALLCATSTNHRWLTWVFLAAAALLLVLDFLIFGAV